MYESVRLIKQAQPKMVIWENVKAVLNVKNIKNVKKYIKALKECGYYNYLIKTNPRYIGFPNIECVSNAQKHILAGNSINIPNLIYVYSIFGMKIQQGNKINELE